MSAPELLVRGATILDSDGPLRVADIRTEGGTIIEVGPGLRPGSARVIDADGMVAMPGLINAHTHSGQSLDRGVAPNLPLDLWLMWVVFGNISITADDRYTLAMAGALEMLESGCTAVLDHGSVPPWDFEDYSEAIMSAYADAGMRAGLAPMIGDLDIFATMSFEGASGPKPEPLGDPFDPEGLLESMTAFFDRWQGAHPRLTPMVGPSAPQRCSHELMDGLARLATERDALFHTHVLETRTQIAANLERYGRSSVPYLEDLGLLHPGSSLAHCVWMDPDEYDTVRRTGTTIVHNPVSNLRCGSGILPVADLLEGGVSVALGADGAASKRQPEHVRGHEVRLPHPDPARVSPALAAAARHLEDVPAGRGRRAGPAAGIAEADQRGRHCAAEHRAPCAGPCRGPGGQPGAGRARRVGAHRDRRWRGGGVRGQIDPRGRLGHGRALPRPAEAHPRGPARAPGPL